MHLPLHLAGHNPLFPLPEQDAGTFNAKSPKYPAGETAAPASGVCSIAWRPKSQSRIPRRYALREVWLSFRVLRPRLHAGALNAMK
jgi:hypothetical protein